MPSSTSFGKGATGGLSNTLVLRCLVSELASSEDCQAIWRFRWAERRRSIRDSAGARAPAPVRHGLGEESIDYRHLNQLISIIMAKLTMAQIRQQIAALETKARRLAEDETKVSVAKVRALMDSLGVTIEHLAGSVSNKVRASKKRVAANRPLAATRVGAGAVRYRDPATGATWSGFGRAPGWLAAAANREDFAVSGSTKDKSGGNGKRGAATKKAATPKKASRAPTKVSASAKKSANAAKRAAKKVKAARAPAVVKKTAPRKVGAKKDAAPVSAGAGGSADTPAGS